MIAARRAYGIEPSGPIHARSNWGRLMIGRAGIRADRTLDGQPRFVANGLTLGGTEAGLLDLWARRDSTPFATRLDRSQAPDRTVDQDAAQSRLGCSGRRTPVGTRPCLVWRTRRTWTCRSLSTSSRGMCLCRGNETLRRLPLQHRAVYTWAEGSAATEQHCP